MDHVLNINNWG